MRAGDIVQLRSPSEIRATLDDQSRLDGVPFMPEMLGYFGRTFTVKAQVERACDTIGYTGVRRFRDTVILDDLRCDGTGHDGCGAQCRLYWKEAWLRPATAGEAAGTSDDGLDELARLASKGTHAPESTPEEPIYRCQATELIRGSEPVGWFSVRSFVHELTSGNVGFVTWVLVMTRMVVEEIGRRLGIVTHRPFRQKTLAGQRSFVDPTARELRPGELVQIRSKKEIGRTLAADGKHRGLWFDREMAPYCGHTTRVKARVERFIDEGTGKMVDLASDCYILNDVFCQGYRSDGRWLCPRAIYPWWRAVWLQPVDADRD